MLTNFGAISVGGKVTIPRTRESAIKMYKKQTKLPTRI
jgi:hypothetical protein